MLPDQAPRAVRISFTICATGRTSVNYRDTSRLMERVELTLQQRGFMSWPHHKAKRLAIRSKLPRK